MNRLSLRTRILLIAVALLAVGLLVGGAVVTGALRDYLVGRVDAQLRLTAPVVARLPLQSVSDLAAVPGVGSQRASVLLGNPYLGYLAADGTLIDERHGLQQPADVDPRLPKLDEAAVAARDGGPFEVGSERGSTRWRVVAVPSTASPILLGGAAERLGASDPGGAATVVVAASLDDVDATIDRLRRICLTSGIALLAGLTVVGWLAIRSGLRPLRRIEETSAAIARGDLSLRVPELAGPRTEVGPGVRRAERHARPQRGGAGREHRIRGADAALHRGRQPRAAHPARRYQRASRSCTGWAPCPASRTWTAPWPASSSETGRLTRLVEDLLLLAELGDAAAGGSPVHLAPTDLRTLAVDALHDVRALDPDRPVSLTGPSGGGAPGPAPAMADEARLRQVVTNLVGNAIAHTPAGTPVRIGVGTRDGRAVLEVADRGRGCRRSRRSGSSTGSTGPTRGAAGTVPAAPGWASRSSGRWWSRTAAGSNWRRRRAGARCSGSCSRRFRTEPTVAAR